MEHPRQKVSHPAPAMTGRTYSAPGSSGLRFGVVAERRPRSAQELWREGSSVRLRAPQSAGRTAAPSRSGSALSGLPWVDDSDLEPLKVANVSCSNGSVARESNAGDLRIAKVDRPSRCLSRCGECCRFTCGSTVEIQDAIPEVLLQQTSERLLEGLPACTLRRQGDAEARFEYRDARCPNGFRRLPIQPSHDHVLWFRSHQRREYVGIENDQSCSSAGLGLCPRISGRSNSSPRPRNRAAIREPSLPDGRPSSLAATRRISRTSASMLRPCRSARRCRRALTSSSSCRTII